MRACVLFSLFPLPVPDPTSLFQVIFFSPPACPYYNYPTGVLSPYGDESLPVLRSLASVGSFDRNQVSEEMVNFFTDYTTMDTKGYIGRLNSAPKGFLTARQSGKPWEECGQDDFQANSFAKVPLVVARYAGHGIMLTEQISSMVSILQTTSISLECSTLVGKLLERILETDATPAAALLGLEADAEKLHLSPLQQALLKFVTSDEKLLEWMHFSDQLDAAPVDPEDGHRTMRIKTGVLGHFLMVSLNEAIEMAKLNEKDAAFVLAAMSAESTTEKAVEGATVGPPSILKIASCVGLSCALPRKFMCLSLCLALKLTCCARSCFAGDVLHSPPGDFPG